MATTVERIVSNAWIVFLEICKSFTFHNYKIMKKSKHTNIVLCTFFLDALWSMYSSPPMSLHSSDDEMCEAFGDIDLVEEGKV